MALTIFTRRFADRCQSPVPSGSNGSITAFTLHVNKYTTRGGAARGRGDRRGVLQATSTFTNWQFCSSIGKTKPQTASRQTTTERASKATTSKTNCSRKMNRSEREGERGRGRGRECVSAISRYTWRPRNVFEWVKRVASHCFYQYLNSCLQIMPQIESGSDQ